MDHQNLTQARIAENQMMFREANERIEAAADRAGVYVSVPFICECAELSCAAIVSLSLEAYEDIREHPRRFFTVPGHEAGSIESGAEVVVERAGGYVVVEKVDVAGEIAESAYPRP